MSKSAKASLTPLDPQVFWDHFAALSEIPRPSGREERVLSHLIDWAKSLGYTYKQDATGNLLVRVPPTTGREEADCVAIQAHVDMVCVRALDCPSDPEIGPIPIVQKGDWVSTAGTTLGADNGIGVSAMLYAAEPGSAAHGPLELLFTVDEERGLTGAMQLDATLLTSRTLLNLDSEDDSAFYVGAAGGQQITYWCNWSWLKQSAEGRMSLSLEVRNLSGGHSGTDIDKNRLNAILAVARLLRSASCKTQIELRDIEGGTQTNVIPSSCRADISFPLDAIVAVTEAIMAEERELRKQYSATEMSWACTLTPLAQEPSIEVLDPAYTGRLIDLLLVIPSGINAMSQEIPGLVETSANLGSIHRREGKVEIALSTRSGTNEALLFMGAKLGALGRLAGVDVDASEAFPPWKANRSSPLLAACVRAFRRAVNMEPGVKAVHAGLECSLIGAKVPSLEMISFGPTIEGAHTPDERVKVSSVQRFLCILRTVLDELSIAPQEANNLWGQGNSEPSQSCLSKC